MSGLLFLGLIAIWLCIVYRAVRFVVARVQAEKFRTPLGVVTTLLMLPMPVADELLSRPAFNVFCKEGTKLKFNPEKIRGRTVYSPPSEFLPMRAGLLSGYSIVRSYADVVTNEVLITATSYHLRGGLLMRSFGLSEWNKPITIDTSSCEPSVRPYSPDFMREHNLKYVERRFDK